MSLPAAHLLMLPRELRDQIYEYLGRDLCVVWGRGFAGWKEGQLSSTVEVQVDNAPFINVLLTHSRLKEEYMQSPVFKRLSLTLRMRAKERMPRKTKDERYFLGCGTWLTPAADGFLSRVSKITLFVDCGDVAIHSTNYVYPSYRLHWDIQSLLDIFALKASNLASVKLALRFKPKHLLLDADSTYTLFGTYLPPPEPVVAQLDLVQRAEAYRLNYYMVESRRNDQFDVRHAVTQVGCYLYGEQSPPAQYWVPSDILKEWPDTKLGEPSLDKYADFPRTDQLPYAFGGWKEKRGIEEARSWFPRF